MAAVEPDFLPRLVDLGPGMIAGFAAMGAASPDNGDGQKLLADWAIGANAGDLPLPFAPPSPIPFHGLLRHAPNILLAWGMLRDRLDEAAWSTRSPSPVASKKKKGRTVKSGQG
jgi:hypothetical protein